MASHEEIQNIIGEALTNETFRVKLIENPVEAMRERGYELTDDQVKELTGFEEEEFRDLLANVEERFSKTVPAAVTTVQPYPFWP